MNHTLTMEEQAENRGKQESTEKICEVVVDAMKGITAQIDPNRIAEEIEEIERGMRPNQYPDASVMCPICLEYHHNQWDQELSGIIMCQSCFKAVSRYNRLSRECTSVA